MDELNQSVPLLIYVKKCRKKNERQDIKNSCNSVNFLYVL